MVIAISISLLLCIFLKVYFIAHGVSHQRMQQAVILLIQLGLHAISCFSISTATQCRTNCHFMAAGVSICLYSQCLQSVMPEASTSRPDWQLATRTTRSGLAHCGLLFQPSSSVTGGKSSNARISFCHAIHQDTRRRARVRSSLQGRAGRRHGPAMAWELLPRCIWR